VQGGCARGYLQNDLRLTPAMFGDSMLMLLLMSFRTNPDNGTVPFGNRPAFSQDRRRKPPAGRQVGGNDDPTRLLYGRCDGGYLGQNIYARRPAFDKPFYPSDLTFDSLQPLDDFLLQFAHNTPMGYI
jgi:hypothetical protein